MCRGLAGRGMCFGWTYQTQFLGSCWLSVHRRVPMRNSASGRRHQLLLVDGVACSCCWIIATVAQQLRHWLNQKNVFKNPWVYLHTYLLRTEWTDLVSSQWKRDWEAHLLLTITTLIVGLTVTCLIPSPPHPPESALTGFWTLAAWDTPNVPQLPGKRLRAQHQQ